MTFVVKYVNAHNENADIDEDNADSFDENTSLKTRIFSDYFRSYQPNDFLDCGYILKRVNLSVWFGDGILHTNTIESLWHTIKDITNNFSGLTID